MTAPARTQRSALLIGTALVSAALAILKLVQAPSVVPRPVAPIAVDAGLLLLVALELWQLLWARAQRLNVPLLSSVACLTLLLVQAEFCLPPLYGRSWPLSLYYFACVHQALLALFRGSLATTAVVRFLLPALASGFALVVFRYMPQAPYTLPYLLVAVTLLLFGVAAALRAILDQKRHAEELLAEQRELDERLASAGRRLREQEKQAALARITAAITHEINNPVNFLAGNLPFLEKHVRRLTELARRAPLSTEERDDLEETRADLCSILGRYAQGLDRIAQTVSGLRRLCSREPAIMAAHDMAEILQTSMQYAGIESSDRCRVSLDLEPSLPVRCVPADLYMLFSNLLTNSLDALEGRPHQGHIDVSARAVDDHVRIVVQDNGRGIRQQDLGRVFEPFYTTKQGSGHMGMGLTLCQAIAESYGGSLSVESREGAFTRVTVFLPQRQGAQAGAVPVATPEAQGRGTA